MSKYIVRLVPTASDDELKSTIQSFEQQGGKVTHNHTLFKGFTGEFPEDKIQAFESNPHVEAIEADSVVHIQ